MVIRALLRCIPDSYYVYIKTAIREPRLYVTFHSQLLDKFPTKNSKYKFIRVHIMDKKWGNFAVNFGRNFFHKIVTGRSAVTRVTRLGEFLPNG
jgi:hypothetical protein